MNADTNTNPPIRRVVGHCSGVSQNNLNNLKPKSKTAGALPQTHLTCEAAGAGGKTNPPTPTASVGSIPRHQG